MSAIDTIVSNSPPYETGKFSWFLASVRLLKRWMQTARSRRHLSKLTDFELEDIGISRDQAIQESEKPFWQGPVAR